MKNKVIGMEEAVSFIHSGMTIMVGGFAAIGSPNHIIKAISETDINDLEIIADDFGPANRGFQQGLGKLIENHQVSRGKVTFVGTNPEALRQKNDGEIELEFVPQGTFAERIRAGGAGIGGFYTPTGVGTLIAEGKETRVIDGREYLFEKPLTAELALIKAYKADTFGNAQMLYTARNFNLIMAMAAETTILEVEELVDVGALDPSRIDIPGVFIDHIVVGKEVVV